MPKKELPAYYPLTLELSQKLRGANLTAAEWRFWAYLTEIDSWGERYKDLSPLAIMTECGMSKPTYYRAKAKFQELGVFDFQEEKISFRNLMGISSLRQSQEFNNSLKNDTASLKNDTASLKNDTASLKNETGFSKMRLDSQKLNSKNSKALPCKGSEIPQTLTDFNQTNKTNQTLSESEGERNLIFWKSLDSEDKTLIRRYAQTIAIPKLPIKPTLPESWISKHCMELFNQMMNDEKFQKSSSEKCSENPPPVENQPIPSDIEYRSIANLQKIYGADWKEAAAHFGIEIKE